MAKTRTRSKSRSNKGVSVTALYLFAVACFAISKIFAGKVEALNYVFAGFGAVLFAVALWKYVKAKKR